MTPLDVFCETYSALIDHGWVKFRERTVNGCMCVTGAIKFVLGFCPGTVTTQTPFDQLPKTRLVFTTEDPKKAVALNRILEALAAADIPGDILDVIDDDMFEPTGINDSPRVTGRMILDWLELAIIDQARAPQPATIPT